MSCNNTHQGAPHTCKETIRARIDRTAVLASAILYAQNVNVDLKIVTDNPRVTRIKRICKNVLHMQHQPEACALDRSNGRNITAATCLSRDQTNIIQMLQK